MATFQVELQSSTDVLTMLMLTKSFKYSVPENPPKMHESVFVSTDERRVYFSESEQKGTVKVRPTDKRLVDAIVSSVGVETAVEAAERMLGATPPPIQRKAECHAAGKGACRKHPA